MCILTFGRASNHQTVQHRVVQCMSKAPFGSKAVHTLSMNLQHYSIFLLHLISDFDLILLWARYTLTYLNLGKQFMMVRIAPSG